METIEVDFDVYKELIFLRASKDVTFNDVIRSLLRKNKEASTSRPNAPVINEDNWYVKGVTFPVGTEFRATYKGKVHMGAVHGGALVVDGKKYHSPSAAARAITNTNLNGWGFWQCRLPGEVQWKDIHTMRSS